MPLVKICGNTNPADALLAKELGADFIGLIFAEGKRKVTPEQAKEIIDAVAPLDSVVGVFANQPKQEVEAIAKRLKLKWVQFHGDETSRYCQHFSDRGFRVIKTFRIKDELSLKRLDEYNVAAFLFDTYSKTETGGSGKTFDWSLLEDKPSVHEKLFLAGGLTVDNLKNAITRIKPYAVDVASGVEKQPGVKDPELLRKFIFLAKGH